MPLFCKFNANKKYVLLQFIDIGIITSIEINHKQVDVAKKGQEVCVKIEPIPGEAPKMYGRHFEATDILVSKVNIFKFGMLYLNVRTKGLF